MMFWPLIWDIMGHSYGWNHQPFPWFKAYVVEPHNGRSRTPLRESVLGQFCISHRKLWKDYERDLPSLYRLLDPEISSLLRHVRIGAPAGSEVFREYGEGERRPRWFSCDSSGFWLGELGKSVVPVLPTLFYHVVEGNICSADQEKKELKTRLQEKTLPGRVAPAKPCQMMEVLPPRGGKKVRHIVAPEAVPEYTPKTGVARAASEAPQGSVVLTVFHSDRFLMEQ